jgi:lysozyme
MANPTVVDISHYQQGIDFAALKAGGTLAVIMKCTEGWSVYDKSFENNQDACEVADLAWCSYHYLHHGKILEQMQWWVDHLGPRYGERMCIDYEHEGCTLDDLHEAVAYLREFSLQNDKNLQITVYSGHLLKEQLNGYHDDVLADYTSLWLAQYTTGSPSWPGGTYKTWSLWQYTDQASVSGYDGFVDGNRFNGSDEQLLRWIGPTAVAETPAPQASEMTMRLSSSSPVTIRIEIGDNVTVNYRDYQRGD